MKYVGKFILFFLLIHSANLKAETKDSAYVYIVAQEQQVELSGKLSREDVTDTTVWFFNSQNSRYKLHFKLDSLIRNRLKSKEEEILSQKKLQVKGFVHKQEIAVTGFSYQNQTIDLSDESDGFDLFIDYDGDGICDKRESKLRRGVDGNQSFRSYKSIRCSASTGKGAGSSGNNSGGNSSGNGGNHGWGNPGGG